MMIILIYYSLVYLRTFGGLKYREIHPYTRLLLEGGDSKRINSIYKNLNYHLS